MFDRDRLTKQLGDLDQGAQKALAWVDDLRKVSPSVSQQADSLIDAAWHARLAARRLSHAATRNNCVGVFGPSQAGKSYLVSALARERGGRLAIKLGPDSRDFLRDINPPGDRESTGLVTRFSVHAGADDPDYPIEVRLLTETDLVKILANSFFLDFDPNSMTIPPIEDDDLRKALATAEAAAGARAADHLDDIALFDLTLYIRHNFKTRVGAFDRADFWRGLIRVGGRLALRDRAELFSMLWGRAPEFTDLFIHLAEALASVGNAPDARVAAAGLIPREVGSPPEPNSIIDVGVLSRLRTPRDAADLIALRPIRGGAPRAEAKLPRATLTALIAEVSLTIETQPWPFFEHTDLLDFPGARSRLKLLKMPEAEAERDAQTRELYLRGKIAYLFQRYTDELELTSMLLCMPPSVAEVKDLAGMVNGWIAATHGATPARRKAVRNALFLILTKHDLEFVEKGGEDEASRMGKWDRRLHASLLELYGKDGWTEDWDGAPFANTYFLRNPGMKQLHLMTYRDEASLDEGPPVDNEAFRTYRRAFTTSALTARHFGDREAVWDAAMEPNDGGVAYLVERLVEALDPDLKQVQAAERLAEAAAAVSTPLRALYHAEGDDARRARDDALTKLRLALNGAFQRDELRGFAHLRRAMMLDPADVRGVFLNTAALREDALDMAPAPAAAAPVDDPWADAAADAPPPMMRRERPDVFADRLINLWAAQLRDLQGDDAALGDMGLSAELIGPVIDEMLVGAGRVAIARDVAEIVRRETRSAGLRWADVADRVTPQVSMRFNDFVAYLGFADMAPDDRPDFPEAPRPATRKIFSRAALKRAGTEVGPEPERLERAAFVDWGVALRAFGAANVGHSAGREISDAQNSALGDILNLVEIEGPRS